MRRIPLLAAGLILGPWLCACGNARTDTEADAPELAESALSAHGNCDGRLRLTCEALASSLGFPDTAFTSSVSVPAGTLTQAGQPIAAHCLLTGKMKERISPVDGQSYAIGFEMRLPRKWSGRFFYQANGGLDGNVVPAVGNTSGGGPLTSALAQGFAVISSDAGHSAAQNPNFGIDPEARLDYGYRAVGALTPMAKAVIRAAYGRHPAYSYIGGCSNGGRHAMVAAARYSDQYDGYLVGSPGLHLPRAAIASVYGSQQYASTAQPGATIPAGPFAGLPDLSTGFTPPEQQLLVSKILERCDALDGLTDGIINAKDACQGAFDLGRDVPTCAGDRDGSCLTAAQKQALGKVFEGPHASDGHPIYASFPFDSGHAASGSAFWEFVSPLILDSTALGFVFSTPPSDPTTFIPPLFALTADPEQLESAIAAHDQTYTESALSFMDPPNESSLAALRPLGGRMILYHGTSDPIFSVNDTTQWLSSLSPLARNFARLYLIPGMNHCGDGPATDQFDLLTPLVRWVERGIPPHRVVASARGPENPGGANPEVPANWAPDRTRPLCPYPQIAVYTAGDPERASSFVCR